MLIHQSLCRAVVDVSSRPGFYGDIPFTREKVGDCQSPFLFSAHARLTWYQYLRRWCTTSSAPSPRQQVSPFTLT